MLLYGLRITQNTETLSVETSSLLFGLLLGGVFIAYGVGAFMRHGDGKASLFMMIIGIIITALSRVTKITFDKKAGKVIKRTIAFFGTRTRDLHWLKDITGIEYAFEKSFAGELPRSLSLVLTNGEKDPLFFIKQNYKKGRKTLTVNHYGDLRKPAETVARFLQIPLFEKTISA